MTLAVSIILSGSVSFRRSPRILEMTLVRLIAPTSYLLHALPTVDGVALRSNRLQFLPERLPIGDRVVRDRLEGSRLQIRLASPRFHVSQQALPDSRTVKRDPLSGMGVEPDGVRAVGEIDVHGLEPLLDRDVHQFAGLRREFVQFGFGDVEQRQSPTRALAELQKPEPEPVLLVFRLEVPFVFERAQVAVDGTFREVEVISQFRHARRFTI
jgi:hypothetical protein